MRVIGVLFHRRGELLHAGRRLFNRRRLLLSTGSELVEILPIVFTTPETICPPRLAFPEASSASLLA
ncbi:hypothetical protein A9502_30680 [Klebsiella pneumoniae]|nr:hypothetical protein A9502_30680 [Klebsiella pneumoniae]